MKVLKFSDNLTFSLLDSARVSFSKNSYGNNIIIENEDEKQTIKGIYNIFNTNSHISYSLSDNIIFDINYNYKYSTINYTVSTDNGFRELIDIWIPDN